MKVLRKSITLKFVYIYIYIYIYIYTGSDDCIDKNSRSPSNFGSVYLVLI